MYLYRYDKKTLTYKRIWVPAFYLIPISIIILTILAFANRGAQNVYGKKMVEYESIPILIDQSVNDNFSPNDLYQYIKDLNIKCPKVVMCQAIIETGFSSNIFKKNHNIFNMKAANLRPNTQIGYDNNYAVYANWKESVIDYAIWQAFIITPSVKTDSDYLNFLEQAHFAESGTYVAKLKNMLGNFDEILETHQKQWEKRNPLSSTQDSLKTRPL